MRSAFEQRVNGYLGDDYPARQGRQPRRASTRDRLSAISARSPSAVLLSVGVLTVLKWMVQKSTDDKIVRMYDQAFPHRGVR